MGIFDLFSNDDANTAASQRNAGLQSGYNELSSQYGQGRQALTSNYGNASGLYQNLINSSGAGAGAYSDAAGANGAAGYDRARTNFQTNPGYQFQMDQGLQALNRTHAAAGNLSSGNADADTLKYATGLANQSYTGYLAGLQPYLGQQTSATQGAAGVNAMLGNQLNANYTGQGAAGNANYTGQGASDAAATLNNYNIAANQLNGLSGLAGGLFGSGAGGSGGGNAIANAGSSAGGAASNALGGLSNLFSMFI